MSKLPPIHTTLDRLNQIRLSDVYPKYGNVFTFFVDRADFTLPFTILNSLNTNPYIDIEVREKVNNSKIAMRYALEIQVMYEDKARMRTQTISTLYAIDPNFELLFPIYQEERTYNSGDSLLVLLTDFYEVKPMELSIHREEVDYQRFATISLREKNHDDWEGVQERDLKSLVNDFFTVEGLDDDISEDSLIAGLNENPNVSNDPDKIIASSEKITMDGVEIGGLRDFEVKFEGIKSNEPNYTGYGWSQANRLFFKASDTETVSETHNTSDTVNAQDLLGSAIELMEKLNYEKQTNLKQLFEQFPEADFNRGDIIVLSLHFSKALNFHNQLLNETTNGRIIIDRFGVVPSGSYMVLNGEVQKKYSFDISKMPRTFS